MYKICYNEKVIFLGHLDLEQHLEVKARESMVVHYTGKVKMILQCIDNVEKNKDLTTMYILYSDVKKLKNDFFSQFKIIVAAGGLVINRVGEVLFIFRRGHWDLPKGKMEGSETKKQAALREVKEETALKNLKILKKLNPTYHIYRGQNSQKRILKPSYWYLMVTNKTKVTPQKEEDIEKAEWKKLDLNLYHELTPIYHNIKDVLKDYLDLLDQIKVRYPKRSMDMHRVEQSHS